MRIVTVISLMAISLCFAAGCGEKADSSRLQNVSDQIDPASPTYGIYQTLRATGNQVEYKGEKSQPFLEPTAKVLSVNGNEVQVFEYGGKEDADAAVTKLTSKLPELNGNPHFYRTERVIVLYVGDDAGTRRALSTAIGNQFAGK